MKIPGGLFTDPCGRSLTRVELVPATLQSVESELGSHFKLIARSGPYKLYESIEAGSGPPHQACSISPSQPSYIESILDDFHMANFNPSQTPMEESLCHG